MRTQTLRMLERILARRFNSLQDACRTDAEKEAGLLKMQITHLLSGLIVYSLAGDAMSPEERRKLNQRAVAMAKRLGLDEDMYRQMILNIEPRSGGHITRCDDEQANLVVLALQRALDRHRTGTTTRRAVPNERQHRQIARLMDFLGWHWGNTARFVRQQTGKRSTFQCTPHELSIVIRGMVAIIDGDLKLGKLKLSDKNLQDYLEHTRKFRKLAPPLKAGPQKSGG